MDVLTCGNSKLYKRIIVQTPRALGSCTWPPLLRGVSTAPLAICVPFLSLPTFGPFASPAGSPFQMHPRATPLSTSAAAVPGRHLGPPRLRCSLLTRLPASGPQSLPCVLSSQVLFAMSQVLSHQSRCLQNGPGGPTRSTLPPRPRLAPSRPAAPASGPWHSLFLCPPLACPPTHSFSPTQALGGGCLLRPWMESVPEHGWPLKVPAWEGASWRAVRGGVTAGHHWEPGRKRGDDGAFWSTRCRSPGQGPPRVLPSCSMAPDT